MFPEEAGEPEIHTYTHTHTQARARVQENASHMAAAATPPGTTALSVLQRR